MGQVHEPRRARLGLASAAQLPLTGGEESRCPCPLLKNPLSALGLELWPFGRLGSAPEHKFLAATLARKQNTMNSETYRNNYVL